MPSSAMPARKALQTLLGPMAACIMGLVAGCSPATAGETAIEAQESWSTYFGGRTITRHYRVTSPQAFTGRVSWSFAVRERVLRREETKIEAAPTEPGEVAIELELPEMRPGVISPATLTVAIPGKAAREDRLWIFPADPFANKRRFLRELPVSLFDPRGRTAGVFREADVPFTEVRRRELARLRQGLLVVGEDLTLSEYRGLSARLLDLASEGVAVVCLAPRNGTLPMPVGTDARPRPARLSFRNSGVMAEFDKRLAAGGWPPDGEFIASRIRLVGARSGVVGEIAPGEAGWPWLSMDFPQRSSGKPDTSGRLVVCGFAVIDKWQDSPTPRYFLLRLFERMGKR